MILLLLLILTTGCASATIRSEKCLDSSKLKVLQVVDDGVLAFRCPTDYPSYYNDAFEACTVKGELSYLPVPTGENDYVDGQRVTLDKTKCFANDGTYSYTAKNDVKKTVRRIRVIDAQVPNPAYHGK